MVFEITIKNKPGELSNALRHFTHLDISTISLKLLNDNEQLLMLDIRNVETETIKTLIDDYYRTNTKEG